MKVTIHLGPAKTGSTALQKTLAANRRFLAKNGILYPETLKEPMARNFNHNILCTGAANPCVMSPLTRRYYETVGESAISRFQREAEYIRQQVRKQRPAQVIISGEHLFRRLSDLGPAIWDNIFSDEEIAIDAIAYVRNPAKRFVSLAQQRLLNSAHLPSSPARMRPILAEWENYFPHAMRIKCFDGIIADHQDLTQEFLATVAPELDISGLVSQHANESMSAEAMVILQEYRAAHHAENENVRPADVRRLIRRLKKIGERGDKAPRPGLRPEIERGVYSALASDIDWIANHFEVDLSPCLDRAKIDENSDFDLRQIRTVRQLCEVDEARVERVRAKLPNLLLIANITKAKTNRGINWRQSVRKLFAVQRR
jgi:hypothetical protein